MVAAASTVAALASAAVWWTAAPQNAGAPIVNARASAGASAPGATTGSGVTTVCVGPDRVLSATLLDGSCPAGHTELSLESAGDDGLCELCDPFADPAPPAPDPGGDEALNAVERRIRALETAAYFEVVNRDEQPIFSVRPGGVVIYNRNGRPVATFGTSQAGGYFSARSATGPLEASIAASGTTAGVRILEDGLARVDLAARGGRASLRFPSGDGVIAGIGESSAGSGALLAGTLAGQVKASLTVPNGRGLVSVSNDKVGVVALAEASIGGGMLEVGLPTGDSAVKMGHNANRYGIVMTFPMGFPLIPKSGLPGSYFVGCATDARPACVPAVAQN